MLVNRTLKNSSFLFEHFLLLFEMYFSPCLVDDAGKIEHDGSSGLTMDTETEIDPCKVDGTCPEVIKVYIFKADPGEDDLGEREALASFCCCF